MKLLSVIFKLMHTPDEFPEALEALFTQHFQVHGYNTRKESDLHATHHKKSYGCRKISYRARKYSGIHCDQVSKMKNPSPSLKLQ